MPMPITALAVGAMLFFTAADSIPHFDARPGCQAGASSGIDVHPNIEACMQGELQARDSLAHQWKNFAASDRTRCVEETQLGGPPSYIEVLTCLEIARDARSERSTNGQSNVVDR